MLRLRTDVLREKATEAGDATDEAIARRAGVQRTTITRLLAGENTPSLPTLVRLGAAYGIALDDLVAKPDPEPKPREVAA